MTNFINNLASSYPNTPNCLASDKRGDFWISEDEKTKKSYIVPSIPEQEEQEAMLKINNPHTKDINLLCIDACLFSSASRASEATLSS